MVEKRATDWQIYLRLTSYVRSRAWYFVVAIVAYMLASAAEVFFAQILGSVVDSFGAQENEMSSAAGSRRFWLPDLFLHLDLPKTILFSMMIGIAAVIRAFGSVVGEYLLSRVSFHVVHSIRCELHERLLAVPSAYFNSNNQGSLSNRLTDTTSKLRDTVTDVLKILQQDGGKLVFMLGAMLLINLYLTLLFLALAPVVAVIVRVASRRFRKIGANIQMSMGEVTHIGQESVSLQKTIRAFGGKNRQKEAFDHASTRNRRQHLKLIATKASSAQFIQLLVALAIAALVGILFVEQVSQGMTTGQLVTYVGLAGALASPIKRLSDVNARIQIGLAAASEIFEHIDHDAEIDDGKIELSDVKGAVEFKVVSFAYDVDGANVLHSISFSVGAGQTFALAGSTGSGKTTLTELLLRFYEPHSGEIILDGIPITEISKESLRRNIALVSQDVILFNDTIRANIAFGALKDASEEKIQDAVRRARVAQIVEKLPAGLDTVVGDRGSTLSLGERQRILIARAILKNAPILILDEATSALDSESEQLIQAALDEVMQDRTTLVVAHRLSTIEAADVIAVLEDGRIVERGTHSELLEKEGRYAHLHKSQFGDKKDRKAITKTKQRHPMTFGRGNIDTTINKLWYSDASWVRMLSPVSWSFKQLANNRRLRYISGKQDVWHPPVPTCVVGNITVGGTGKTPLIMWLAKWLQANGRVVGIVSRGYGGSANYPLNVTKETSVDEAGDEAPMLARRLECPIVVDPDRVAAVKALLENHDIDIVLSDDGLQHYALGRDIEVAVIDGARGVGNGLCLPVGPLREPVERLENVDWVVACEQPSGVGRNEWVMKLVVKSLVHHASNRRLTIPEFLKEYGPEIAALAAIGNPSRFEQTLLDSGFRPKFKAFNDHHVFRERDVKNIAADVVIVTEKDIQKLEKLPSFVSKCWYLEVEVAFDRPVDRHLTDVFRTHGVQLGTAA